MAFSVQMSGDSFQVEPGASVSVGVEIANLSAEKDQFEISVEGLEHHWFAVPVPSFHADENETRVERIFLKPPRDSESSAGSYPFVLKVRSLESGETETVQGILEINPYYHLSLDINPRRVTVTPINRVSEASVVVMNLGNVEQTVQMFANDTEDAFAYQFSEETLTLAPGQQRTVTVSINSTKSGAFAPTRLHVTTVSCRNVENPAYAGSAQIHIEQRPLMAPAALLSLAAILVVALLWILTLPKPPKILSLTLDKPEILLGESVLLQWKSEGSSSVVLTYGDEEVRELPSNGKFELRPVDAGELEVSLTALNNDLKSPVVTRKLLVSEPIVADAPEILEFKADKTSVPVNENVTFSFKFGASVKRAYLEPHGVVDLGARSMTIPAPSSPETVTYELKVWNSDEKMASEKITVKFVQVVEAKIARFEATPMEVDPLEGRVTVIWQLANTVSATLQVGTETIELDMMGGRRDVTISEDTTITITAYDVNGLKATKSLNVKVKRPENPDTDPETTGGDGGSTTGVSVTPPNPPTRTGTTAGAGNR